MNLKSLPILMLCAFLGACGGSNSTTPAPIISEPDTTPPDSSAPDSNTQFSALRATVEQELSDNQHSPAVSVAIYHQGEIVFADGFGHKALDSAEPVDKNTLFQLGSITKMFTAMASMQLVEQGIFQVTDPLTLQLPDMQYDNWQRQSWEEINIHHLLTHQSGLFDDYADETLNRPLVAAMKDSQTDTSELMNPPGLFFNYSNPNYSYLGALIEEHTQMDYRQWMEASVFTPLGMNNTTMYESQVSDYNNYALGVSVSDDDVNAVERLSDIPKYPAVIPAGVYTWSTASELLKMAAFLMHGNQDILDDALRVAMTEKHVPIFNGTHYGYGIEVSDTFALRNQRYNQSIWYHGGFTGQYRASLAIIPEQDLAVAVLNSGPDDFGRTMIAAIEAVADLPEPQTIPNPVIDRDKFDKHVGTYIDYNHELTLEIALENTSLILTIPELDAQGQSYSRILTPLGNGLFRASAMGNEYHFSFASEHEDGESVYFYSREVVGIKEGYAPWVASWD